MSGDDLLQPLETIVDGWLIQGCKKRKGKKRGRDDNWNNFVANFGNDWNKLIE